MKTTAAPLMLSIVVPEPAAWHGPYQDAEVPAERRHLVRLWLRAGDRRHFRG